MKTSYIFLAPGFEEIEAVAPIDVLRRAGMTVRTVSITPSQPEVIGAHGVPFIADLTIDELPLNPDADWLILPGGMPGATNLYDCRKLADMLKAHSGNIAAICASPAVVLGRLDLLNREKATCYPGMESWADGMGVEFTGNHVERSGRFITGQGPAWAVHFAAAIVAATIGEDVANQVTDGMLLPR